jgi:hypothetical protein
MNRSGKVVVWISVLAVALSGCARPVVKQAFDPDAGARIRTVLVAQAPNQETFTTAGGGGGGGPGVVTTGIPAVDLVGLIVMLAMVADLQSKSRRLTAAVDATHTRLQDRFSEMLRDGLNAQGYEARIVVLPTSGQPDEFLPFLREQGPADAALVVLLDARVGQAPSGSTYSPMLSVKAKGFDLGSQKVLYEDAFSYGYMDAQAKSWQFLADPTYHFSKFDDMVADPTRVREGWLAGLRLIADKILLDVQRKPAPMINSGDAPPAAHTPASAAPRSAP